MADKNIPSWDKDGDGAPDRVERETTSKKSGRFVAEQHHGWEGLTPEMKQFWSELNEELDREPSFTSGKRKAEDKTGANYEDSHHNHGSAIDIEADPEVYNFLMNNPKGLGLMTKFGLGVLDETDPQKLKQTKGTGPHFHIGTDPALAKASKQRYQTFLEKGELEPILSYKEKYQEGEHASQSFNFGIGRLTGGLEGFQRQIEKEKVKEEKEEKSEARKEIEKKKEKITLGEDFFKSLQSTVNEPSQRRPTPSNYKPEDPIVIEAQTSLPNMPNIFTDITKFADGGKVSKLGYRSDSPDKNEDSLIIPSNRITMQGVDHPVIGVDNLGNRQLMLPGKEYKFGGDYVQEFPIKETYQEGGEVEPIKDTLEYDEYTLRKAVSQVSNISVAIDGRPNTKITGVDQIYPGLRGAILRRIKGLQQEKDSLTE